MSKVVRRTAYCHGHAKQVVEVVPTSPEEAYTRLCDLLTSHYDDLTKKQRNAIRVAKDALKEKFAG